MGVVEIHTWNSVADDVERPNRMVWDLDPGPEITWKQSVAAATLLREVLETLGLDSWVKTTGGRGLHVVVPITPSVEWSTCLSFSRDVGDAMVRTNPALYTTAFPKRGRERQILIDYLRNNRTNTSICADAPRVRSGAPVSVPLDWKELRARPGGWTLQSVARRLAGLRRDPWKDYWTRAQRLSPASIAAVKRV